MRVVVRSVAAVGVALLSTVALVLAWTAATAVQLAATALIMGGTEHPLKPPTDGPAFINPYLDNAVNALINLAADTPAGTGGAPIEAADSDVYAVTYPAEFFPVFGRKTFEVSVREGRANLNLCARGSVECGYNDDPAVDPGPPVAPPAVGEDLVIFGYSQSAVVASLVKRDLIADPRDGDGVTSFFLLANPMRPNGGILVLGPRGFTIPILGIPFYGATPTNSCEEGECMATVDAAGQYDFLGGDAPSSLTNVLALVNSIAAYLLTHGNLQNASFEDARYQGSHGDTDYYLFPAERLPILMPLSAVVPSPILTALDAPLRAAIEGAYHRDINPGVAVGLTLTSLLPWHDPVRTIINIARAIPVGLDDAFAELTGNPDFRPFGTKPATSPYGVGGPDLPEPPQEDEQDQQDQQEEALSRSMRASTVTDEETDDVTEDETGTEEEAVDETAVESDGDGSRLPKVRGPIEFDSRADAEESEDEESSTEAPTTGEQETDPKADEEADQDAGDSDESASANASGEKAAA